MTLYAADMSAVRGGTGVALVITLRTNSVVRDSREIFTGAARNRYLHMGVDGSITVYGEDSEERILVRRAALATQVP